MREAYLLENWGNVLHHWLHFRLPVLASSLTSLVPGLDYQAEALHNTTDRSASLTGLLDRYKKSTSMASSSSFWENRTLWKEFNDELQRSIEVVVHDYSSRPLFEAAAVSEILTGGYGLLFTSRLILSHYEDLFLKENGVGIEADDYRRKLQYSMVGEVDVTDIMLGTAEDARMFCVEKNGLPVRIQVHDDKTPIRALTVPAYVHFVLMELFKNATNSIVDRYGALNLDSAPPIEVHPAEGTKQIAISIIDRGRGLSEEQIEHYGQFLTTSVIKSEPNYHYSRSFGVPMAGLGMGIPLSKVHLKALGGYLEISSLEGYGTTAVAKFGKFGDWELM